MQQQGNVRFLKYHERAVRSVSFNPVERYIFCSGSSDGRLNLYGSYNSLFHYLLVSYPLAASRDLCWREINGLKFTADGQRILCALNNNWLAIVDVETGQVTSCFEESVPLFSNSRDSVRVPIIIDKNSPCLAVSPHMSGKGITIYDTRVPLPFEYLCELHSDIRDITFIDHSWPFVPRTQQGVGCLSGDGVCRVVTLDGKILHQFEVGHKSNSIARTPEPFDQLSKTGFKSSIMIAGDRMLSSYTPETSYEKILTRTFGLVSYQSFSGSLGVQEYMNHLQFGLNISPVATHPTISSHHSSNSTASNHLSSNHHLSSAPALLVQNSSSSARRPSSLIKSMPIANNISLLKYGTNGGFLFATTNSGHSHSVLKFRRHPNEHQLIGELYSHKSEIYDMDISPYDEFIVTASRDRTVGVMCLGSPNHGTTSVSELT